MRLVVGPRLGAESLGLRHAPDSFRGSERQGPARAPPARSCYASAVDAAPTPLPPPTPAPAPVPFTLAPSPAVPPPPHAAPSPRPVGPPPPLPAPTPPPAPAPESHDRRMMRLAAGFYGVVTLFALGYSAFSGTLPTLFGDAAPSGSALLAGLVVGLAIVGLCRIGARVLPAVDHAATSLARLLGPITWRGALGLALLSGVAEELLFRGALWAHLGLFGTTFLFGLVHVVPKRELMGYPLFALGGGLLLGLLRQGSGNVLPAILAHATVNAWNLTWIGHRAAAARAPAA